MSAFKYFTETECPWIVSCPAYCRYRGEGPQPEPSVGLQETRSEDVNARMATADHDRQGQATHRRYKLRTVVEFASGKGHA